jgi:LPS-assembly protein
MKRICLCLVGLLLASEVLHAAPPHPSTPADIIVDGLTPETEWTQDANGTITFHHGARVTCSNVVLTADSVTLNRQAEEALAEGAVVLHRGREIWLGERLQYNFRTRVIKADRFRTGLAPFFLGGSHLALDSRTRTETATNAFLTTDDVADPGMKIRARRLRIVPGQYVEARGATVYLDGVPVMYLPRYRRSLRRHPNNFVLTPGYRSLYGPYLKGAYHWYASTNLSGAVHLDYRERRGVGVGPDLRYNLGKLGEGSLEYYYLHDHAVSLDLSATPLPKNRQRFTFTHELILHTNLTAKVVVRQQSDPYVMRDFFEAQYMKNVQPSSFAEVNRLWPNFSLDVLAQPRVNDFFETVERLPDVRFSAIRQRLGISPLYYESDSSLGYFRHLPAANPLGAGAYSVLGTNFAYSAFRADTFHQLLLPQTFFGWLNVTPRIGGRFTHYDEVEMAGVSTNDRNRAVFNTGVEVAFKVSRLWKGARSRLFDLDGLRHIVEPSVNYVYVPRPDVRPMQLPQFDTQLPTLWLLPIDYPDYNAIDSVDSQNVFRFGLHNRLQTKRRGRVEDVLNWALYTDWRLTPTNSQTTFSDVYSQLDLKPRPWLTLTSETRYDINGRRWTEANHYLTIQPNETWSWAVGHLYFRDDPALYSFYGPDYGNNFFTSRIYLRASENWGFRIAHQFDARVGTLNGQYYTIYRDLRSWTAALTFRYLQSSDGGPHDVGVALTFSLKAFPRFGLGQDRDQPSLLLGG